MAILQPLFKALRPLLLLLPLTCAAQFAPAPTTAPATAAEPALVTIFARPLSLKSVIPGTKDGVWTGRIFDGDLLLAHVGLSRFVTFAVTPGSHTFAANCLSCKSSSGGGKLTLNLEPGQHYFVQASMTISGSAMSMAFVLKEVRCADAQETAKKSKAVTAKDILPDGAKVVVPGTTFPPCPAKAPPSHPQPPPQPPMQ
jgi:hypothetical protein